MARPQPPEPPSGEVTLESPPGLVRGNPQAMMHLLFMVPMMLGMGGMSFVYIGRNGGVMTYLFGGLFLLVMIGMVTMALAGGRHATKAKINEERRDYQRYLSGLRRQVYEVAELPETGRLSAGPWTRCTRTSPDRPAAEAPISTVLLGRLAGGTVLRGDAAIVAGLATGERFLLTGGHRHRLPDEPAVVALGLSSADVLAVASPWLNTIPAGRDLRTVAVDGAGRPGPAVGASTTRIGQVLVTGAGELYLVRGDGLAVTTETEALLVLGGPAGAAAYPGDRPHPLPVAAADVAAAPRAPAERGYPARLPRPVPIGPHATVCADGQRITVGTGLPLPAGAAPITTNAPGAATEVYVPGGHGAVVAAEPGASSGTVYVVTDTGMKYPVSGDEARAALGYGGVRPVGVPAAVLALFPTGVTLDPAQARRTLTS